MRNLASIQKILAVEPIPNADKIEVATVLGWKVVVGKDQFKVGDKVVYIEIDSVLPDWPEFTEIRKKSRYLKTIRLRGQISQGLCMPMSILDGRRYENDTRENPAYDFSEGQDVTDLLKIIKYEPTLPACLLGGDIAGPFPTFIPKTDETRIQSVPSVLQRHADKIFYATEKIDGSSCTIYHRDGHIGVCGRNYEFKDTTDNAYMQAAISTGAIDLMKYMRDQKTNIALQGELIGPGVNGSRKFRYCDEGMGDREEIVAPSLVFFNAYDIDTAKHAPMSFIQEMRVAANLALSINLPWVRSVYANIRLGDYTIEKLVSLTNRVYTDYLDKDGKRLKIEGLVFRPYEECHDEELGRLSFKVINPLYLLQEEA
jgi:RNA ligase (TIGR02306 family)